MLISMTERWKTAIDNDLTVGAVFIDFQKAFDTVPHYILSHKLHAIGISGSLHEWLMSYLTDRRQFTEVNNCRSATDYVRYGVPQGSLLGPRLYTIYVNDLPDHIDSGDLYMYADDTTVYCIGPNVDLVMSSLNKTMKQVLMWSVRNQLTIHPIKTEAMIIRKSSFVGPIPPLYFNTGHIDLVNYTTCLGVKIDNKLTWSVHIDSVKKHFTQKVGALKRMRILPKKALEEIYFKTIIPSVTYGISVWGNCSPSALNSLHHIHARAARIVNNLNSTMADDTCLMKSDWLPISYFYKKSVLLLMHKVYYECARERTGQNHATDKSTLDCQLNAFSPTSIIELSKVARTVASKSCSLDPLPAVLLKENFDMLLPTLCRIVNLSLESGYVPISLKTAVLLPLLKKPSLDHEILSNYRPISNLKVISKMIEKVVAVRLQDYLETNQLNEPLQSAYKRLHSCETALVRVHNDILRDIDDRHCVILLLLDLSAAFDTVDHDILLGRLNSKFSICGTALEWFRSYLTNRTQFTLIDGTKSQSHELKCGVPQGSVLGPILYLLYTAPLADILRHHEMQFHFYADDTQLYISFSTNNDVELTNTIGKIEECLSDLDKWMSINKLKLNKDKTELLYLYSKHNPQQSLPPIRFGQDIIQPSQFARNIGVIFDRTMTMLPHISSICKSASYHLRNISRIRKYLSTKTTEILVHAFVSSKLDHCNSLLYNVPKYALKKLQSVQNAAARLITCSRKYDHITPILKELHWLPVSERIKFKILLLTFKALHQQSPIYIQDLLTYYQPSRTLRSSHSSRLNPVKFHLKSYGSRAFSVSSPELWNSLPVFIRSCDNLSSFKSKLKTFLFKTYYS
ncbi:hypothetical protein ACROYT_G011567 [Oculina patagonica]